MFIEKVTGSFAKISFQNKWINLEKEGKKTFFNLNVYQFVFILPDHEGWK